MLDNSITSLDIDKIGHQVIREKEVIKTLVDVFGNSVPKDDVINRSKLSELVFKSKPKMEKLKAITWRYIEKEIDYFINDNVNEIIILDWALLPKTKYFKMSNLTILVVAKAETRFNRLINREQIDLRKFRLRENAALTYLNNEFDYVISNDEDGIIKGWWRVYMTKVLYPGSFDPITKGHMNIIGQASSIFDEVIVAILKNPSKNKCFFTDDERWELINKLYSKDDKIKVVLGSTLAAVDVAQQYGCSAIIRGLRGVTDFDYEIQLAQVNKSISNGEIITVSLFADNNYQFISSSMVREIFSLGKDAGSYVDDEVLTAMKKKQGDSVLAGNYLASLENNEIDNAIYTLKRIRQSKSGT